MLKGFRMGQMDEGFNRWAAGTGLRNWASGKDACWSWARARRFMGFGWACCAAASGVGCWTGWSIRADQADAGRRCTSGASERGRELGHGLPWKRAWIKAGLASCFKNIIFFPLLLFFFSFFPLFHNYQLKNQISFNKNISFFKILFFFLRKTILLLDIIMNYS